MLHHDSNNQTAQVNSPELLHFQRLCIDAIQSNIRIVLTCCNEKLRYDSSM